MRFEDDEPVEVDCSCGCCNPSEEYQETSLKVQNMYGTIKKVKVVTCTDADHIAMALYEKLKANGLLYFENNYVRTAYDKEMEYGDRGE